LKQVTINKRSKFPQIDKCLGDFFKADEISYLFPLISSWAGSDAQAVNWLKNEKIPALGNKTALEVCQNNQPNVFLQYIHHIEYGVFA
jgi:hypothetical protein